MGHSESRIDAVLHLAPVAGQVQMLMVGRMG